MKLRILGSGTIAGQTNRNCSGYLVDDCILLDCGPGIWRALDGSGSDLKLIDKIFISHFHVDHISDLIPILWARHVLEIGKEHTLSIFGPPGVKNWFKKLTHVHRDWISQLNVKIQEILGQRITADGYIIETLPTFHTKKSICYRMTDSSNISLFYSGDTGWNDNLVHLANVCNLAIMEASVSSENQAPDHLSPQLAARIARRADVKMLMLTHFYPEALIRDPLGEAAREFDGKIVVAQDGLTLNF